jgi:hypothetical protein
VLSYGRSYRNSCSQVRGHPGGPKTPRYFVERTFPEGLHIPVGTAGPGLCPRLAQRNAEQDSTWLPSHVSDNKRRNFCAYETLPKRNPEAAGRNDLPAGQITRVQVFDPNSYM